MLQEIIIPLKVIRSIKKLKLKLGSYSSKRFIYDEISTVRI